MTTNSPINSNQTLSTTSSPTFSNLAITYNALLKSGGFNPNTYSTGTISITDSGVTGSGTTFTSGMENGILKITSGPNAGASSIIIVFNSATSIEVESLPDVSAGTTYVIEYGGASWAGSTMGLSNNLVIDGQPTWGYLQTFPGIKILENGSQAVHISNVSLSAARAYTLPDAGTDGYFDLRSIIDVSSGSRTLANGEKCWANKNTLTTFTLPTPNQNDRYIIYGVGSGGWTVVYGSGQSINIGNQTTTTTSGSLSSTNQYDAVEIIAFSSTQFIAYPLIGNLTVA